MIKKLFTILICGFMLTGCSDNKNNEITVFVAASLSNAMEEIKTDYESDNKDTAIIINADSSGTLKTQITEGAQCDLFISAAEKQTNELSAANLVENVKPLLENQVVLIKPKGMETQVTSFENITLADNIALAGEDVPVGSYSREIFENLGIYNDVMNMEINECSNVTNVLGAVAEGANQIGIVYATDASSLKNKVDIIAVASDEILTRRVVYPMAEIKGCCTETEDFVNYINSKKAQTVFEKYGFKVIK